MTVKTFIRLMLLLIVATSALLMSSASTKPAKTAGSQAEECCGGKDQGRQAGAEIPVWESFSRSLLSGVQ